jgi:hypothetical protein
VALAAMAASLKPDNQVHALAEGGNAEEAKRSLPQEAGQADALNEPPPPLWPRGFYLKLLNKNKKKKKKKNKKKNQIK